MPTPSQIKWYPPLDRTFGKVSRIEIAEPTSVATLLARLRDQEPRLDRFARFDAGDGQVCGLLVVRGERQLKMADVVEPGDEVEIMLMPEGG